MLRLDRDIADCHALVIDSNPTSRSILATQLRDFGVVNIAQATRVQDARRQLEAREFDIVLCEHHFSSNDSGQDLLDDLRRAQLLPYKTVFIMVTGEANYDKVAEAAESALDGYLLKPHTATALAERVKHARHRKKVLRDIFQAIEDEQFDVAARLCLQRFHERSHYWLYAARIGAELLLRLDQHAAAAQLYEAVIAAKALPWAKLGVARAQIDANQPSLARRTLESLIVDEPTYADAYDVMGRLQVEQGQLGDALATYRQASELTPSSISRLQKQGMLAFYMGERGEASKALERAAALGISSKMFDLQSLVLLAFARFHQRDSKGLQRCLDNLEHALQKAPQSARLRRFSGVVRVLVLLLARQTAAVVRDVRALANELGDDRFDVEAACNMLSLVAQLAAAELQLEEVDGWIDTLALRFCTSKGLSELLARAAEIHAPYAQRVRDGHMRVSELAEQATTHTLAGNPRAAVKALIAHGGSTRNLKLIEMARMTLQRHHDKVPDAADLQALIEALRTRYAAGALAPPLGQAGRQAGGLSLRTSSPPADGAVREVSEAPAA